MLHFYVSGIHVYLMWVGGQFLFRTPSISAATRSTSLQHCYYLSTTQKLRIVGEKLLFTVFH